MRWFGIIFLALSLLMVSCSKKGSGTGDGSGATPEELLAYADNIYLQDDYESAFLAYGLIYEQYPTSREYVNAAIGLSRCYAEFEDYQKSFDILYSLLQENIIPSQVPKIYNVIAEFYERSAGISEQLTGEGSTDYKTAIGYYEKAIDYPNSEDKLAKSYAQYKVGTLYEKLDNYDKALKAYQKTSDDYPTQQWAMLANEKSGILQLKIERMKIYESAAMKKDTMTTKPQAPAPVKKKIEKPEKPAPAKADTTKTTQPEEAPADTTGAKPKLDLD